MEVVQEVLPGDGFAKMIESHSDGHPHNFARPGRTGAPA